MKDAIKALIWNIYHSPTLLTQSIDQIVKKRRCLSDASTRLYLGCQVNNRQPRSAIKIGKHSRLLCKLETYKHGGRIEVGDHCFIGENTRIWSSSLVSIGSRVLISHDVNIHDNNSHSLSAENRHQHFKDMFNGNLRADLPDVPSKPIIIGDDAWIGFGSAIFKGVTIGQGAVVAAMSVVTKDVPPYTVFAGNPARHIGSSRA